MIEKYSRYKLFREFLDFPNKDFHLREISRMTNISQPSAVNHLKALIAEGLILREKKGLYPTHRANRDNELFKTYKKIDLILRLFKLGLVDKIYDLCTPDAIILFGSAVKGEDIASSDIDLFVQAPEKKLDLKKYEKLLNRKISLFFKEDFSKLSKELKNNILNGTILRGYLKVF